MSKPEYDGIPLPGDIFEVDGIAGTLEMLGKVPGEDAYAIQWILPGEEPERKWFQWSKAEFQKHHFIPA